MAVGLAKWLEPAWEGLLERVADNRMPHAILVHGPAGLLKHQLAFDLAKLLLCRSDQSEICGVCPSCAWFEAGSHPDFVRIQPIEDSQYIRVDQIRGLSQSMSLTSGSDEGYRVALIRPAHRMNTAASNALLKTLEEPPGRACLILVADSLHTLPATVLSRCQRVAVGIPPTAQAYAWMDDYLRATPSKSDGEAWTKETLDHALFLAAGSPGQALVLLERGATASFAQLIEGLISLRRGRAEATGVARQLGDVPLTWTFSWLQLILHQCMNVAVNVEEVRAIPQALAQFSRAHPLTPGQINQMADRVVQSTRRLSGSLRADLLLEDILCDWAA